LYPPARAMFRSQFIPAAASLHTKADDCRVNFTLYIILTMAHVINDQPVSVEAQIPTHNSPCGIYVEQSDTETDCLRVLQPSLPIPFRISPYAISVISHRSHTTSAFDNVVSGVRRRAYGNFALLVCYGAQIGSQ
jgi:hypothetical protein